MSATLGAIFDFDPFDAATIDDPFPSYRILRDEFPVYRNAERDFWAVSRADDVYDLLRDWQTCSSSKGMDLDETGLIVGAGNFLNLDPPDHDTLRKVVRSSFSARRIAALEPVIRRKATELIDRFVEAGHSDLVPELTAPLPIAMVSEILGVPESDQEATGELIRTVLQRRFGEPGIPAEALSAAAQLADYFEGFAADRRSRPQEDGLSEIVRAEYRGAPMTHDMILGLSLMLFGAGSETVSNFMSNALAVLARHPEARAELFAEPAGIPTAVEELLRFESPVQNLVRTSMRPMTLHGQDVPSDARLLLLLGSANRDERRYKDADRLDLRRPPKRHVAFGDGIHFCLGGPLARLEAKVILEVLGDRIPHYEIAGPVTRIAKVNSRGLERLPVVF
jgi:cytochrome P450